MESKTHPMCISISQEQYDFIQDSRKSFKLSKFVQAKLDDYMKLIDENKQFMEKEEE